MGENLSLSERRDLLVDLRVELSEDVCFLNEQVEAFGSFCRVPDPGALRQHPAIYYVDSPYVGFHMDRLIPTWSEGLPPPIIIP